MRLRGRASRDGEAEKMRKSNWIIAAILLVASLAFLWLWQALQFNLVDNPIDIVVTVVWWVVIVAGCVAIHLAEKRRQERIRTVFLAPGLVYNCEAGVLRVEPGASSVDAIRKVLVNLTYSFDLAELPANSRVRFQQIVRTERFADGGRTWEGEVVEVRRPDAPRPFHNQQELVSLLHEAA